jgi:predicted dehydrogenase
METERKVTIYDKGSVPRNEAYAESVQVRFGDIHIPKISGGAPLRLVCEHFVRCVARGETPLTDGWAGVAVVEVLEAMTRSLADRGRPVELEGART